MVQWWFRGAKDFTCINFVVHKYCRAVVLGYNCDVSGEVGFGEIFSSVLLSVNVQFVLSHLGHEAA